MLRSALLLGAGLVAALLFACVQSPPVPPPAAPFVAPKGSVTLASGICNAGDADSFVKAIKVLEKSYDPQKNVGQYDPPSQHASAFNTNTNTTMTTDLKNAFSNSPDFFQQRLCGLNGIYISPAACPNGDAYNCNVTNAGTEFEGGWGFRSRSMKDPGNTYIAISAELWPSGSSTAFHTYETQVISNLPAGAGTNFSPATPDDTWISVLAALAHEMGHVRWAVTTMTELGKTFNPGYLQACPIDPSTKDFFYFWNYNSKQQLEAKGRWREFGKRENNAGGQPIDHKFAPTLFQLGSSPYGNLYKLYQADQPWASLFGAQSPDEDFVEAFVIYVLTGFTPDPSDPTKDSFAGPLSSLPLTIPGFTGAGYPNQTADIPNDLVSKKKSALQAKLRCIPQ